ncbi:MAG: glycosyl hydrolase 115 family protein, partial [Muribaculaceae bacterium]|nr:glycosyl hydrolase 115 family protein [Muribaculaceae bacterium]
AGGRMIIAVRASGPGLAPLRKSGAVDLDSLVGKTEQYVITTVDNPLPGVDRAVVVAGSDRRGAVYGLYELSEQIGVSPWYDWADVPVEHHDNLSLAPGTYTAGEPAVRYRGLFLNDEAPCLTSWVKNTYGTGYGDHRFYERVFELLLRLRGNYLWPAMWGWAFYADDSENSATADRMGVIMGTSHHEPMARNHQEWARHREDYGKWNYATNQKVIDRFFAEGIERMKGTEDIVTIGMRGDGDEAMSEDADVALLKRIIDNQRKIIARKTGRKASETPQLWALYKEVLDYYDKGLRVPDDVIILVCDDNWGNVRRLPDEQERKHPGGWGMYYHVDYVGAPRNTKWINVTPIQGMWEQLRLTYDYGVDKLWILNVGDLKPMEYPITLFMDMAWNPERYDASNFMDHPLAWCEQQFGKENAAEAARILNLYSKYNGRVTAEMLDKDTYDLESGEWRRVADEYARLEAEALRQYVSMPEQYRDAYFELILFPVQAMANIYQMYYAQAMNHKLAAAGDPAANEWADLCERCFRRDAALMNQYNHELAGGKWNGMMTQKHIGYTIWNDDFPADTMPALIRVENTDRAAGGYVSQARDGAVVIEAEHFREARGQNDAAWTVVPDMGRTLSGVALMPYTVEPDGDACLTYEFELPDGETLPDSVAVHVVVKSSLDFTNRVGHCY